MEKIEIGKVLYIRADVLATLSVKCDCEDDSGTWTGTSDD